MTTWPTRELFVRTDLAEAGGRAEDQRLNVLQRGAVLDRVVQRQLPVLVLGLAALRESTSQWVGCTRGFLT